MGSPDDLNNDASPFESDADSRVPGELIVTLSDDANATASQATSAAAGEESTGGAATSLGIASVDQLLANLSVTAIDRVHDEVSGTTGTASEDGQVDPSAEVANQMEATYLVSFNPEVDPTDVISQLSQLPEVVDVEPNYYYSTMFVPNDTDWAQQWGPVAIHCPDAWDRQTGSSSVTVAIVDSGVDLNHPDLQINLLQGRNFVNITGAAPKGYQYVGRTTLSGNPDTNAQDEVGHGTHVAGIVGAIGNNGQGVAGVVWGCRLLPVRVMARAVRLDNPAKATGFGTSANIAAGIRWAADQGANIINLSLGGPARDRTQANAVAYAQSKGVLVVAAMGNENTSRPSFPAALPGVMAVASIGQTDQRSPFSNTGPHCAISAPGERIHNTYFDFPNSTSTYGDLSGTSMATPHVAGVAAMIWSADTSKTSAYIATTLTSTARAMPNPDPLQFGTGCVDALAALNAAAPQVISGPDPETQPVSPDPSAIASSDGSTPADTGVPADSGVLGDPSTVGDPSVQGDPTAAGAPTMEGDPTPLGDPGTSQDPGVVPA